MLYKPKLNEPGEHLRPRVSGQQHINRCNVANSQAAGRSIEDMLYAYYDAT